MQGSRMRQQSVWTPNEQRKKQSLLSQFIIFINKTKSLNITTYEELHEWSISQTSDFWASLWKFSCVIHQQPANTIFQKAKHIMNCKWFIGSKLNYAENLLHERANTLALIEINEKGESDTVSLSELKTEINRLSQYWRQHGVKPGDRIAAVLPNNRFAIIAMLACSSVGAVWSCCSPDFGSDNILDRLSQISPSHIIITDEHQYKGKVYDHSEKIKLIQNKLNVRNTIIVTKRSRTRIESHYKTTIRYQDIPKSLQPLSFESLSFDHPLMILFSSGTTGKPKCIIHGAGGTLLQHIKEHQLHCDIKPHDRVFFYTTTGWMMWNWLISALASEATLVLYDGCPTYKNTEQLFSLIDEHKITHFGVSAKYIELCQKNTCKPNKLLDFSTLRTVLSTGSPLLPKSFDYIYQQVKSDVCLNSISGGTDIVSCFALGNPFSQVLRGEIQCKGLGMAVEVYDQSGNPVIDQKGELVCTQAFPSMPLGFYNDTNQKKYKDTYFTYYDNVWAHRDFASIQPSGGLVIYGRSDSTLNPGGVRIGTAEIYRQVDKINSVIESVAVGYPVDGDERIILFVVLKKQQQLTEQLSTDIKQKIKDGTSAHHVPHQIIAVPELPRTLSGKLAESTVRKKLFKLPIDNQLALINPDSLNHFDANKIKS